ncbi:carbohydrate ABC transporter permease [Microbacterium sp. W4I4]|uniref:carbohydrate ABC transporter permease n=1 Tax=Microbacterium sp. W4I4 TaxID=3042295 RepID=UPI0027D77016|nr:carbohydrate ABC transporter permease [Microbacterium sp. W4I4]
MSATTVAAPVASAPSASIPPVRRRRRPWIFHVVMTPIAILWILPLAFVVLVAFRTFADLTSNGLGSLPQSFTLEGFVTVFRDGLGGGQALINSVIVTGFTVVFSLLLASWAAFALSKHDIPGRRAVLLVMLAGNLLPPQILLIPVARICESLGIADTLLALIIVQVAFGLGFYTFVLHGFMRSLPGEIFEAARVDGAGPLRTYLQIRDAAVPPVARRARRLGDDVDLERPAVGADRAAQRVEIPDHRGAAEHPGRLRQSVERGRRRRRDRGHPHRHRVLRVPEAVRVWSRHRIGQVDGQVAVDAPHGADAVRHQPHRRRAQHRPGSLGRAAGAGARVRAAGAGADPRHRDRRASRRVRVGRPASHGLHRAARRAR